MSAFHEYIDMYHSNDLSAFFDFQKSFFFALIEFKHPVLVL